MYKKKEDYISVCESLFKYLDSKKVSTDNRKKIMEEIIVDFNNKYDFSNNPNYCSSPLEYIEYKKKKSNDVAFFILFPIIFLLLY